MDIEREIKQLISIFDKAKWTFEENEKIIKDMQGAQTDYMHNLELNKISDVETVYLDAIDLRKALISRRKAKDENMLLEDLYRFVASNEKIYKEFSRLLTTYQKKSSGLDGRQYEPRTLKHLDFNEAKDNETGKNKDFKKMLREFKREINGKKKYGKKYY